MNVNSILESYKAHTQSFIDLMNNLSIKYKNCLERIIERFREVYKMTKAEKKLIKAYIEFLKVIENR